MLPSFIIRRRTAGRRLRLGLAFLGLTLPSRALDAQPAAPRRTTTARRSAAQPTPVRATWEIVQLTPAQRAARIGPVLGVLRVPDRDAFETRDAYRARLAAAVADSVYYIAGFHSTDGFGACAPSLSYDADRQAWYLALWDISEEESWMTGVAVECTARRGATTVGETALGVTRPITHYLTLDVGVLVPLTNLEPARRTDPATPPHPMLLTGEYSHRTAVFPMAADTARDYAGRLVPYILFRPTVGDTAIVHRATGTYTATLDHPVAGIWHDQSIYAAEVTILLVDRTTGYVVARALEDTDAADRYRR